MTDEKPKISTSVSSSIISDYITPFGFRVGKGPVNQTSIDADIGKNFTLGVWRNTNFRDESGNETDVYCALTNLLERKLWGYDFSGKVGFEAYTYDKDVFGHTDNVATAGIDLRREKWPDIEVGFKYLFGHDGVRSGHMVHVKVSQSFDLTKVLNALEDAKIRLATSVTGAYGDDFFDDESGPLHITPGMGLELDLSPNTTLGAYVARQFGYDNHHPQAKDRTIVTAGLKHRY